MVRGGFGATWEAGGEVGQDGIRAGHPAFRGGLHVLVKGQITHQVVGIRQHDGVFQAFAKRGHFSRRQGSRSATSLRSLAISAMSRKLGTKSAREAM